MVNDFSEKIASLTQHGPSVRAAAQKNIASSRKHPQFGADQGSGRGGRALAAWWRAAELGQDEKKGVFGFFQKKKNDLNAMKASTQGRAHVNKIVEVWKITRSP
jgi:hypothetical protein